MLSNLDTRRDYVLLKKSSNATQSAATLEAHFDPNEMSSDGITLVSDAMVAKCSTGNNTHVLLNCGFTEGQWVWEFLLEEDRESDECTCFGVATKPVSSSAYVVFEREAREYLFSYSLTQRTHSQQCHSNVTEILNSRFALEHRYSSSPSLWMYRCYNGQLYRRGQSVSGNKAKIHPNAVVRCELDMDAGTLSYANREQSRVLCSMISVVRSFLQYVSTEHSRAVRLLRVERVGGT